MNRSLLVGLAGVVIILAALGLNFWLNRDASKDVAALEASQTPRVEEAPSETPQPPAAAPEQTAPQAPAQPRAASEPTEPTTPATPQASESGTAPQPPAETTASGTPAEQPTPETTTPAVSDDTDTGPKQPPGRTSSKTAEATAPADPEGQETAAVAAADTAQGGDEDAPSFDVVRLSRKGDSVFAGRGKPGTTVDILSDDETIGSVEVDDRGEWVFVPTAPLEPGSHELSLRATEEEQEKTVDSDHVVVLVVPKPGEDISGRPAEEESEPLALLVPSEGKTGETRVLQKPTTVPGGVESETGDLALDIVDYDDKGSLALSGRGQPNASVRVYLDNDFVGEAPVDEEGFWRAVPDEGLAPGVYDLRVDQVVGEKVVARLELPFSRAAPITSLKDEQLVIVQPGNSLWRIARRTLGRGLSYSVIYEANKDQIGDPDLIYPGQIFQVPRRAVN